MYLCVHLYVYVCVREGVIVYQLQGDWYRLEEARACPEGCSEVQCWIKSPWTVTAHLAV